MVTLNALFLDLLLWLQSQPKGITFVDLNKGDPQPNFFTFILGTFKLIGIGLIVVAAVGAVLGLLRIWMRRRFPENRLNGVDAEPLTFLKLNKPSDTPGAPAADA